MDILRAGLGVALWVVGVVMLWRGFNQRGSIAGLTIADRVRRTVSIPPLAAGLVLVPVGTWLLMPWPVWLCVLAGILLVVALVDWRRRGRAK